MEANNMAVMREALVKIEKMAHCDLCNVYPRYRDEFNNKIGGIEREARAALSAPPRNCDVFKTESEGRDAFIAYFNEAYDLKGSKYAIDTCDLKHDVDGILHDYIKWLFDAAESKTKEGNDASK